jgi:hypothetical protein
MFKKLTSGKPGFERLTTQEMIGLTVDFSGPRLAGGAGNRIMRLPFRSEAMAKRGFARPGRAGH